MNQIRIIPAIVRAFFSSFVDGIVVGTMAEKKQQFEVTPKQMKELLINHYEEVSKYLFHVCFNPFALVSYNDVSVLESLLRRENTSDPQTMLKYACGGAEMCELMIEEYRRNFYAIMGGRVMSVEEFFDGIDTMSVPARSGNVSEFRAIQALVLTVKDGFNAGRHVVGADKQPLNQIDIYRLLEDNMQCLMHDAPVKVDDEADLNETFLKVCGSLENMNTMLELVNS